MIYLQLFWSFFQIGLFSFGGGYAAMPLIQSQVVTQHGWLTMTAFTDLITLSQMTPGPIAINSATFVGIQIAGVGGALVATLGCVLPSCAVVAILSYLYSKYQEMTAMKGALGALRPAVVALIFSAGLSMLLHALFPNGVLLALSAVDWVAAALFAVGLFVLRKFRPSPTLVMIGSGVVGGVIYLLIG